MTIDDSAQSTSGPGFWWLRHDWVTYKVPVPEGKIVFSQEYLSDGFAFNERDHRYRLYEGRKDRRKFADFYGWSSGALFVNEKAFAVFEDMFLRNGRAYPVLCNKTWHFIVLTDLVLDAIDIKQSKFNRLDKYPDIEDDMTNARKLVLREGFTSAADIFRPAGRRLGVLDNLIVSDAFKARYEESGLTGLFFTDMLPLRQEPTPALDSTP